MQRREPGERVVVVDSHGEIYARFVAASRRVVVGVAAACDGRARALTRTARPRRAGRARVYAHTVRRRVRASRRAIMARGS